MAKTYKGSLSLEWYNKQKSILLKSEDSSGSSKVIPAPVINWVNKDEALFYEIVDEEGRGLKPYWVDRNDIRVKEARPLLFQKVYKAIEINKPGTLPGTDTSWEIKESNKNDTSIENILIKGDNLLSLNSLKKFLKESRMKKK
jgi:adenine-specific DNA-methyltransferase